LARRESGIGCWKQVLETDFETIFRTIFLEKVLQEDFLISFLEESVERFLLKVLFEDFSISINCL